ncbi:MAG: PorT family protein [Flavobacteriaceae bacterium]|nr:PorT family protein [Flavobacteriaceae bacterium]
MSKILILFLFITSSLYAQVNKTDNKQKKENYYLEDQLYLGITYNILSKLPNNINQSGFSNGIFLGFIKDLPTNKMRNIGFGIGLGYAMDTYFQNLKIHKNNNEFFFENFQDDENFKNNKFILHSIELPLEFRFRTSTIDNYKFWRVYTGIKFKYIFYSKAAYKNKDTQKVSNLKQLDNFNYGITLGAGNGVWNVHLYYGLKPIFKDAYFKSTELIKMRDFKIGLIFYIL